MDVIRGNAYEVFSYVHPEVKVKPNDVMEFMTEEEYLAKFKIDSDY
jgi:hypothetical protein